MGTGTTRAVWASVAVALFLGAAARGEMKIEQRVVGPAANDAVYVISPAGGRVAVGMMKGSRFVVAGDGAPGPEVD
jgi:hypothetical protein